MSSGGSRSARLVALARAHLNWLGVIDDPLAERMLAPAQRLQAAMLRTPGLGALGRNRSFAYLAARTLFYDDFISRALDGGIRQVVILAGGYDSRGWRLARDGARFFEVDLPDTQAAKRARAPAAGPTYVAADVTAPKFMQRLVDAGYDPAAPAAFTVEGLTMYLSEAQVVELLGTLGACSGSQSRLAVNFGAGFELTGSRRGRLGRATMANAGERFRFRLSEPDAPAFMRRAGWEIQETLDGPALRERFLANTVLTRAPITNSAFVLEASLR